MEERQTHVLIVSFPNVGLRSSVRASGCASFVECTEGAMGASIPLACQHWANMKAAFT